MADRKQNVTDATHATDSPCPPPWTRPSYEIRENRRLAAADADKHRPAKGGKK